MAGAGIKPPDLVTCLLVKTGWQGQNESHPHAAGTPGVRRRCCLPVPGPPQRPCGAFPPEIPW